MIVAGMIVTLCATSLVASAGASRSVVDGTWTESTRVLLPWVCGGVGVCEVGEGEINCKLQISTSSVIGCRMLLYARGKSRVLWVLILHAAVVGFYSLYSLLRIQVEGRVFWSVEGLVKRKIRASMRVRSTTT